MATVETGLDVLMGDHKAQSLLKGRIGYLCHSASVDKNLIHGAESLSQLLGDQLGCLFGPQHGQASDVQDNMVETADCQHPYFKRPVYSLYGQTRAPTDAMLEGIDTLVADLQDVGTRVYTYLTTLALCMDSCQQKGVRVVVLDRPNPAGPLVEGRVLEPEWKSFVGHHPIPQRHGLTLGEAAQLQRQLFSPRCDLHVVPMRHYHHQMLWEETGLAWVNPSPNLSTPNSALTFPGTVLFEGTTLSEGRGTTRALEVVGAPGVEPYALRDRMATDFEHYGIQGVVLRPTNFCPTFQKHGGASCGGLHLHVTDARRARTWRLGQLLLKHFKSTLGQAFAWNTRPYEYEYQRLAIDLINGGEELRHWVEKDGTAEDLAQLEAQGLQAYGQLREQCLLYPA